MKKFICTFLIACISISAFADEDSVHLLKGQAAPYEGFLITREKANSLYDLNVDLQSKTKINALLQDEQAIYAKRLDNAQNEATQLAKELSSERNKSFMGNVGYFVLGAVLTGFISYGLVKSIK